MSHKMKLIRNTQVQRILLGVPLEHKHLRALIELKDGTKLVIHEATLASIVHAFLTTKLDPLRDAIELIGTELTEHRADFADYQLLDTKKLTNEVKKELTHILNQD